MTTRRRFLGSAIGASTAAAWSSSANASTVQTLLAAACGRFVSMLALHCTFGGFDDTPDGVYVSPDLFNTPDQLRGFAAVIRDLALRGVPVAKPA